MGGVDSPGRMDRYMKESLKRISGMGKEPTGTPVVRSGDLSGTKVKLSIDFILKKKKSIELVT